MLDDLSTPGSSFGFGNCVKGADPNNNRKLPRRRWIDVLRQASFVFYPGVPGVLGPIHQPKVLDAVVSLVPIDVIDPFAWRNFSVVPAPDHAVEKRAVAKKADLPVWTGFGAIVSGDMSAAATDARTPGLPEEFSVGILEKRMQFGLARKVTNGYSHRVLRNRITPITSNVR